MKNEVLKIVNDRISTCNTRIRWIHKFGNFGQYDTVNELARNVDLLRELKLLRNKLEYDISWKDF